MEGFVELYECLIAARIWLVRTTTYRVAFDILSELHASLSIGTRPLCDSLIQR